MRETLSFDEVKAWFRVGDSVSVHVTNRRGTVGFLDGPIDSVMGFEGTDTHGVRIEGAAGAWTLQLAEPEFVSATLNTIPDSRTVKHLVIKMRDHWVMVDPPLSSRRLPRPER